MIPTKTDPLVVTKNVTVVVGETSYDLVTGQELSAADVKRFGVGKISSMCQVRTLVHKSKLPPALETETEEPKASTPTDRPNWRELPVAAIATQPNVLAALAEAKLATVGDVVKYGADHGGKLSTLKGIGEKTAADLQQAIQALVAG